MRIAAVLAACLCCPAGADAVDLVVTGGRIWTGDPSRPEASALAVADGRIVAVGDDAAVLPLAHDGTQVIALDGRRVVPGINDAHAHVDGGAPDATELALPLPEPGAAQVLAALAAEPTGGTRWITGTIGGVAFADARIRRAALDALHPTRPVRLDSLTGHGTVINSAAQRAWPFDPEAPVAGGWVGRDATGAFDGRLYEYARWRAQRGQERDAAATVKSMRAYADQALSLGITSIQNMPIGTPPARFLALWQQADVPLRLRLVRFPMPASLHEPVAGHELPATDPAYPRTVVLGTKWVLDGTPVERGAALRQPYPGSTEAGTLNFTAPELRQLLREAIARDDQPLLHASGDAAVAAVLDAMEAVAPIASWPPRRLRIEHGEGLAPDLMARARDLGVVVVQNPAHFRGGDDATAGLFRDRTMQPLADLLARGIPLALGSDGPMNPWLNLMWAGAPAARPDQALTREQALRAYTAGSAFAEFQEGGKGRLVPGHLADFAVLSQDVLAVPAEALPTTRSMLTVIGGDVAWRDPRL